MSTNSTHKIDPGAIATSEDVERALGSLDDMTIAEILTAKPSLRDLSDAALWQRGDGDLIAREHRELTARAQTVIDILDRAGEDWPEEDR